VQWGRQSCVCALPCACAPHTATTGPDGDTALHLACLYGHLPCVQQLLAAGCKGGAVNSEDGTSPLHDAAAGGHLAIVQLLLSQAGGDALLPLQVCVRVCACV
jgi:ankyrin repeat protein